jgi:hypothetical protein
LEEGKFKLRVRALEVERSLQRSKMVEGNIFRVALSTLFLNAGSILLSRGGGNTVLAAQFARLFFTSAAGLAVSVVYGMWKIRELDQYLDRFLVTKK